jgi:uncharacterized CHY-type Zn-finger protein
MDGNSIAVQVMGKPIDHQTRCIHYHTVNDIIAIKFKCCDQYYPCYSCHEETAGHAVEQWPKHQWNCKAILCGNCKHQLTIEEYMRCDNQCPQCKALFNPNCKMHYQLYFEMKMS